MRPFEACLNAMIEVHECEPVGEGCAPEFHSMCACRSGVRAVFAALREAGYDLDHRYETAWGLSNVATGVPERVPVIVNGHRLFRRVPQEEVR